MCGQAHIALVCIIAAAAKTMTNKMDKEKDMLDRARLLLGDVAMAEMDRVRVIIFGVGGVGSWCAESLVRSGVRHLTIVDSDVVCVTNINRQLMATTETVGQIKVDALKAHLLTVNPAAEIDTRREVFTAATADSFRLDEYDYIIDAIDSLRDKMTLIETACRTQACFFSSMGAALKLDPTRVRVAEFWRVEGCPLARALRQRFKKAKTRPARKFMCVYSEERLENKLPSGDDHANGSLMHITAIFGLTIAGLVIRDIAGRKE